MSVFQSAFARRVLALAVVAVVVYAFWSVLSAKNTVGASFNEARRGFETKLTRREADHVPAPKPPPNLFTLVRYDSPAGKLAAYVTAAPRDRQKHPALIWITGGNSNSIGDVWTADPADDDETGAFRKAGLILMYPSLRGGNDNPGFKEGLYGEVDDVRAAAEYLAAQPFVDPARIYLAGHSTGGTLALLAAAATDRFRAVFAFGPVDEISSYGSAYMPFKLTDAREAVMRSPIHWLNSIHSPTFVLEGIKPPCNQQELQALQKKAGPHPRLHFLQIAGASHFSILTPATRIIAAKMLRDTGATCALEFTEEETEAVVGK